jgi:hypothetical protein
MTTLDDLALRFELHAVCIACRRMERLDIAALIGRFGRTYPVTDVRARVRCRACGARTRDIRIAYAGTDGGARGFFYRGNPPSRGGADDVSR